jgi:TPR repeat protein
MRAGNVHYSESDLARYGRRALPWRELLIIDEHLKGCPACATRLARKVSAGRARALVRSLLAQEEEAHLSYEQMEALAERRLQLSSGLEGHLRNCRTCEGELSDLRSFLISFRAPKQGRFSWRAALRELLDRPLWLSGVTTAAAAISFGLLLLSHPGRPSRETGIDSPDSSASRALMPSGHSVLEECGERELASGAPAWFALYEQGDFNGLTAALRKPAERGNAAAQTVLGLLTAQGIGAERNLEAARGWLRRAAVQGDSCARQMLAKLNRSE